MENILDAAADGKLAVLEEILRQDPLAVHARDGNGWTPLHYAALEGQAEAAELLLSHHAEINARDKWDKTPLYVSIFEEPLVENRTPLIKVLLSHGADVSLTDDTGWTPLHMAALFGEAADAELLLKAGADINARNDAGETPLHEAAAYSNLRVAPVLLAQPGIQVDARDGEGLQVSKEPNIVSQANIDVVVCSETVAIRDAIVEGAVAAGNHDSQIITPATLNAYPLKSSTCLFLEAGANIDLSIRLVQEIYARTQEPDRPWIVVICPEATFRQTSLLRCWEMEGHAAVSCVWMSEDNLTDLTRHWLLRISRPRKRIL